MTDKTTFAFRVSADTAGEIEDYVEERGVKKSDVLRRAAKQYIDEQTGEDRPDPRRSASPVTILGVVAIAIAPTLLATGYTALGSAFGVLAAVYGLLWVTALDTVLEDALDDGREKLREAGGVVGFFRHVRNDHHVEDPDTVVERAARLDLVADGFLVGLLVVVAPLGIARYLGWLEPFLAVIGTAGATAIVLLVVVLAYGFALLMAVSAVASLAIAAAAEPDPLTDDATA